MIRGIENTQEPGQLNKGLSPLEFEILNTHGDNERRKRQGIDAVDMTRWLMEISSQNSLKNNSMV